MVDQHRGGGDEANKIKIVVAAGKQGGNGGGHALILKPAETEPQS
jgi:hypothetical protein